MAQYIDKTYIGKIAPNNRHVLWIDISRPMPVMKSYLNGRWSQVSSAQCTEIVDTDEYPTLQDFLASEGEMGVIYLYPNEDQTTQNRYKEYIWINDIVRYELLDEITIDISGKADKVNGATAGNFAGIDSNGNLIDSGHKHLDYASASQGSKADTAIQSVTVGTTTTGAAGTNASVSNSGTATDPVFDFTIPRGADGVDAVNPFKGWYTSSSNLPANPSVGDYAYVKGAESTDPAAIYECTTAGTWSDSGRTVDTSNAQTFESGEEVNETYIDDTHLVNPKTGALPTANDAMQLKAKLEGVTAEETKVSITSDMITNGYLSEGGTIVSSANYQNVKIDVSASNKVRFLAISRHGSSVPLYTAFYNESDSPIGVAIPIHYNETADSLVDVILDVPTTAKYFRTLYSGVSTGVWSDLPNYFYCYLHKGDSVIDTFCETVKSVNLLNPSDIAKGYTIKRTDGTPTSSSSTYGYTPLIKFEEDLYCNSCVTTSGASMAGCIGFAADGLTVVGYTSPSGTSGASPELKVLKSVHPTWEYVRFNLKPITGNNYIVCKLSEKPESFVPYSESDVIKVSMIKDGSVTPQKASFFKNEVVSDNILDPSSITLASIAKRGVGTFVSANGAYRTDYISIDSKGLFINHAYSSYGTNYCGACIYDANKQFVAYRSADSAGNSLAIAYREGFAYVVFNIPNENLIETVYVCRGTRPLSGGYEPYVEKLVIDKEYLSVKGLISTEDVLNAANEGGIYTDNVEIVLPDKFYAVVGDTLQLFYQGMVISPFFKQYDVNSSSGAGRGLSRYFTTQSPSAGNYTFSVHVQDQSLNNLATKSCSLVVVNQPSNPSSNKNILCIGDSLTAGGKWVCECQRRLKASDGTPQGLGLANVTFVGSMSKTLYGQTAKFYGKSGWGWSDFCTQGRAAFRFHITSADGVSEGNVYTNNSHSYTVIEINNLGEGTATDDWTILCSTGSSSNTPQSSGTLTKTSGTGGNLTFTQAEAEGANLLWDATNNRIGFKKYCETNAGMSSSETLDYLVLLLTWNQLPNSESLEDWEEIIGYITDMFDALHEDYPNCKVKLMGIPFPYMDSFISATSGQHTFMTIRRNAFMNKLYQTICNDETYASFVEFVNISAQFDSEYNYPYTEKNVNTRNSNYKERFVNNTVHPGDSGYMQIADAAYRVLCAALN